ncbi:creatininase family protein [Paenibacillus sp. IB182496]|uniref:Creatininase family protein n=1 Tax=Paenibacillus sabuli TaxID=2772509 RepID=A0A927BTS7_9BACL|nr:creatininase family protein [Paenibacillus sabuli]MBD2845389.1 creatininase family protein [Paenibacillus sabuli]
MTTRTHHIKHMSWTAFETRKQATQLAILPAGAMEGYGPHLPLGADTLVATRLAELVAARTGGLIGPVLEAGDSSMLAEFPGTIAIRPESFKQYVSDVVESLLKWGFTDLLVINGHAGNVPMYSQLAYALRERGGIRMAQIDVWRFIKTVDEGILESGALAHSHAGEAGTSVLLAVCPELVDLTRTMDVKRAQPDLYPEIMKYGKLSDNSKWGTMGNSTIASAQKGEQLVARAVDRILHFLRDHWSIADKGGQHEQ